SRLLQLSPQRAVSFRSVYELERPNLGQLRFPLILSSRSYSESTSTPPFPKDSGSTRGSQSSNPKDTTWFKPKAKKQIETTLKSWDGVLFTGGIVGAGYVFIFLEIC